MPKIRKFQTREALIETMGHIVSREVKHFRCDFDTDKSMILDESIVQTGAGQWYWITRECGTYLYPCTFDSFTHSIMECYGPENVHVRVLTFGPCAITMQKVPSERIAKREIKIGNV